MLRQIVVAVLGIVLAVFLTLVYDHYSAYNGHVPKIPLEWWGDKGRKEDDTTVKPFKINVPDEVLHDLMSRLNSTRPFYPPLEGVGFRYGFNTNYLQTILDFWKTKYLWREREKFLNSLPQFTTEVAGLKIHMIHVKPTKTDGLTVLPLLLVHGWPGSLREFYKLIPLLTTPRSGEKIVFEVIAPHLPGYGFSQGTNRPGLGAAEIAVLFDTLMQRLGFKNYYLQGGDWGAVITTHMAALFPERVKGLHSNMCVAQMRLLNYIKLFVGSYFPSLVVEPNEIEHVYPMSKPFFFLLEEGGYFHLQATKPDTVGVALRDSPIGLATYILEKFSTWTNSEWRTLADGGLQKKYDIADLLDNVMIYWVTGSITSSMRLYSETFSSKQFSLGMDYAPVNVPTVCARFRYELSYQPKFVLKQKYKKLVAVSDFDNGGHFAAFENPQEVAGDVWKSMKLILEETKKNYNK